MNLCNVDIKRLPQIKGELATAPRQYLFSHHRQVELVRFFNFYNAVKPRKGLNNATPYEILMNYFNQALFKH